MGVRSPSKGENALKELQSRKHQGTLSVIYLDVTKDDSVEAAIKKIKSEFGRLDVLVNKAGIMVQDPPTRESLHTIFVTNVFSILALTNAALPLLQASNSPKVINVTSELGSITMKMDPGSPYHKMSGESYHVSKAALNMLSACQAISFQGFGCKVWAYCPGYVVTDIAGVEERQRRRDRGAESLETSAQGILEIVEGVMVKIESSSLNTGSSILGRLAYVGHQSTILRYR